MSVLTINVVGTPAPQGSKRGYYNQHIGRVQMVESSKKVKPWRQDVKAAALDAIREQDHFTLDGPVEVDVVFYLARPRGHYSTAKNRTDQVKASAPWAPSVKPDLDKLVRSTMDALGEARCWTDDSRVTDLYVSKRYADDRPPGAVIKVRSIIQTAASAPDPMQGEQDAARPATPPPGGTGVAGHPHTRDTVPAAAPTRTPAGAADRAEALF